MFIYIFVLIIIVLAILIWKNKLILRFDTLFRKGFKKSDDFYGVYCYVGKQGTGKTYSCVDWLTEQKKKYKLKVITNVNSYYLNNKDDTLYIPNFYQMIAKINDLKNTGEDKNYIIFFDELFTLLEKGKLDKNILGFISQLRKREIYLVTTVQEWLDINVTFRRYCRYYIDCSMINIPIFHCAISINQVHDGYNMQWNNDINEYESPIISTTIKKCSLSIANSYDTFETIK